MATRNVVLTDHHVKMIDRLVKAGRYQNASEVLQEGLRLVHQREARDAAKLKALREAARLGIEAIGTGDFLEFGSREEIRSYLEGVSKTHGAATPRGPTRRARATAKQGGQ